MALLIKPFIAAFGLCALSHAAQANDLSDCEVLLLQVIETDAKAGEAQIASYVPADAFLKSIRDDAPGHVTEIEGQKIRALMCRRNDVIPTASDYDIMATDIPFILSQDFDSSDTDSLTIFWKDGQFEHVYKGYPLSSEAQTLLDKRLTDFSNRGLQKAPK